MTIYTIIRMEEYIEWYKAESARSKAQIEKRLALIEMEGHFGHIRDLDDALCELKFNDGRRIYYIVIRERNLILLLGGNKNGQDKDIKKARSIIRKIIKG